MEGHATPSEKGTHRPLLMLIGALGSLVGVVIPVASYFVTPSSPYAVLWTGAVAILLTGIWFGVQAVGFLGIYRSQDEIMGLVAFVFGLITAVSQGVLAALLLIGPGDYVYFSYYYYTTFYYIPVIYQAVTTAVQATAFLLIREVTGNEKLFVAAAIALIAAGSISWLSTAEIGLSVSNVFVTICFLKIRKPSEPEPKSEPQEPIMDALKELQ